MIFLKLTKRLLTVFILGGLISPLTSLNAHESPGMRKFVDKLEKAGDSIIETAAGSLAATCLSGAICSIFRSIEADPEAAVEILEAEEDVGIAIEAGTALSAEVCVLGGCE